MVAIAIAILAVALLLLPALGVWVWSRTILNQVEGSFRAISAFEPGHFEIGPQADRFARPRR